MSDFEYSAKTIKEIMAKYNLSPVVMKGVYGDLKKLKPVIENIYDKYIFYLSYWESECGYHGWDWSKDNGEMKNMATITDEITNKFLEIYALILLGLGESIDEQS